MKKYKAFTLVEVLVVLVIVAILASLIMAASRSVIERSKNTVCISNSRQIAVAMNLYESDYSEYPPNVLTWPGFKPYLGNAVFVCPSKAPGFPNYFTHGYFDGSDWESRLDLECRMKRGSSFPLVYDSNHYLSRSAYASGERFVVIARMGGSGEKIKASRIRHYSNSPGEFPCPGASVWSNL